MISFFFLVNFLNNRYHRISKLHLFFQPISILRQLSISDIKVYKSNCHSKTYNPFNTPSCKYRVGIQYQISLLMPLLNDGDTPAVPSTIKLLFSAATQVLPFFIFLESKYFNDVWVFDTSTLQWKEVFPSG